jgi:hypothetical protein
VLGERLGDGHCGLFLVDGLIEMILMDSEKTRVRIGDEIDENSEKSMIILSPHTISSGPAGLSDAILDEP